MRLFLILTFSFLSSIAGAQDSEETSESSSPSYKEAEVIYPNRDELANKPLYWMCRASTTVRTLKVEFKNGSCKTIYNKDGVDRDSGQSKELTHCYAVFKNIKKNLESNMWACKDISNSQVVTNE